MLGPAPVDGKTSVKVERKGGIFLKGFRKLKDYSYLGLKTEVGTVNRAHFLPAHKPLGVYASTKKCALIHKPTQF